MIPKIIHYVWVGGGDKPRDIRRCMKTWKKHLKGYQIIEWNEQNFDIHQNKFMEQAYAQKKWAYVSDYIRLWAIYNYGGIYLDTDVLVLDDLTAFLEHDAFIGFENRVYLSAAIFGAKAGHPFIKDMLEYYNDRDFTFDVNDQLASVNSIIVSDLLIQKYHCQVNDQFQVLEGDIAVYPNGVLSNPSSHSSTIHVFTGTWMEGEKKMASQLVKWLKLHIKTKRGAGLYNKYIRKDKC